MQNIKCVVVGDNIAGKTDLLNAFTREDDQYQPVIFTNKSVIITYHGKEYNLVLFDTTGLENYDTLRTKMSYQETDIFLLCFSVSVPESFENLKEKWAPEIKHVSPETPFIVVGTQVDLRNDVDVLKDLTKMKETTVTQTDGQLLAKKLGAVKYVECSSFTKEGLKDVFYEAVRASVENRKEALGARATWRQLSFRRKRIPKKMNKTLPEETSSIKCKACELKFRAYKCVPCGDTVCLYCLKKHVQRSNRCPICYKRIDTANVRREDDITEGNVK